MPGGCSSVNSVYGRWPLTQEGGAREVDAVVVFDAGEEPAGTQQREGAQGHPDQHDQGEGQPRPCAIAAA